MGSDRTVDVLYRTDPVFREFASTVLKAGSPQEAWELLYTAPIEKMDPEPTVVHVPTPRHGMVDIDITPAKRLLATGRKRKREKRGIFGKASAGAAKDKVSGAMANIASDLPGGRIKPLLVGTTAVTAVTAAAAGAKARKSAARKVRGYDVVRGERPPTETRPHPVFGKADASLEFDIVKSDGDKKQVFGWASVITKDGQPVLDRQGDIIEPDEMEKSAYQYVLQSRKGGRQHRRTEDDQPVHVSDMIESMAFTPEKIEKMGLPPTTPVGWWVGFKVNDDEVWEEVKKGRVTSFSIHGRGKRLPLD